MWVVEVEDEVESWLDSLQPREFAAALAHVQRLEAQGNKLRPPATRSLGEGLFELRFDLRSVSWRITFRFAARQRIVLMTVFRKQRRREQPEIRRARTAMQRSIASEQEEPS